MVVASNLFGDILSDLGPACTGTIGIAPSANINPERNFPSLFEPVHGSAPDIAGKGIANPVGTILSAALLLRWSLGLEKEATAVEQAVRKVLDNADIGGMGVRTGDLGGKATCAEVGDKVLAALDTLL